MQCDIHLEIDGVNVVETSHPYELQDAANRSIDPSTLSIYLLESPESVKFEYLSALLGWGPACSRHPVCPWPMGCPFVWVRICVRGTWCRAFTDAEQGGFVLVISATRYTAIA